MSLDFNAVPDQQQRKSATELAAETTQIKQNLLDRLDSVLAYLLPAGQIRNGKYAVGNTRGDKGDSLEIEMAGARAGLWKDFATGEGGDIFSLWAAVHGLDARHNFPKIVNDAAAWLGKPADPARPVNVRSPATDDLGVPTAKWDYHDANGQLIACVYRYDTPDGKEFRPWDVRARRMKAPTPRPLYNLPDIVKSEVVILVEGEKCADTLIGYNLCATTAMNGARAPIDKTDWSPLKGKLVLIWPDNDQPGMDYAQNAAPAIQAIGARQVKILSLPPGKPDGWDAADAFDEGFDCQGFIQREIRNLREQSGIPAYSIGEFLDDRSPMPPDIIAPRVLTLAGMLVFGGAPKVGKSDFVLAWLCHMAAGISFLGMTPKRPLRIFILQAEIQYHYLRERIQSLKIDPKVLALARDNLVITPQVRLILNEAGLAQVVETIRKHFPKEPPDIIVIDPLRNVFDGGQDGHENDNNAMLFFLQKRVEMLRDAINPDAGIIIAHHTTKIPKKVLEEDPFRALSGAGALRGYYTTGMLLYRPDESRSERQLFFELRNGEAMPFKVVDKAGGQWVEIDPTQQRLVRQDYGAKLDAERRRKNNVILQLIYDEAKLGRVYTPDQFAERFEGVGDLGAKRTIGERISIAGTKGEIKFFKSYADYKLCKPRGSKFGYMCVEGMELLVEDSLLAVLPTHFKAAESGIPLPVEDPQTWIYHDGENNDL